MHLLHSCGRGLRGLSLHSIIALAALLAAAIAVPALAAEDDASAKLEKALAKPIELEFIEAQLSDVAEHLSQRMGVPVSLDKDSLADARVRPDTPITINLPKLPARSAIGFLLYQHNLKALAKGEGLVVVSDRHEEALVARKYSLDGLISPQKKPKQAPLGAGGRPSAVDELQSVISATIDPKSWANRGGRGSMEATADSLDIQQTQENHRRIAGLLDCLRQLRARTAAKQEQPDLSPIRLDGDRYDKLRATLRSKSHYEFIETPISDVATFLSDLHRAPILIDIEALNEVGFGSDTPTRNTTLNGLTLESVLNHTLWREMTWTLAYDTLLLTTNLRVERREPLQEIAVFPVHDLVSDAKFTEDRSSKQSIPPGPGTFGFGGVALKPPSELFARDLPSFSSVSCNFVPLKPPSELFARDLGETVDPRFWRDAGGPYSLVSHAEGDAIVVRAPPQVINRIEGLLAAIRKARDAKADDPQLFYSADGDKNAAVFAALEKSSNFEFNETPLSDVATVLSRGFRTPVVLDVEALESIGVSNDVAVRFAAKDMKLRHALQHMLAPLELTYAVRDEAIVVTSPEEAEDRQTVGVYRVGFADLPNDGEDKKAPKTPTQFPQSAWWTLGETVAERLEETLWIVAPESWSKVGGPGEFHALDDHSLLMISQTTANQNAIGELLSELRDWTQQWRKAPDLGAGPSRRVGGAIDEQLLQDLSQKHRWELTETPLRDVVELMREKTRAPIVFRLDQLDAIGVASDEPIEFQSRGASLRQVFDRILPPLDLWWAVKDGAIVVTSEDDAEESLATVIYPMQDFILPVGADPTGKPVSWWNAHADYDSMIDLITRTVAPNTWDEVGGPASIELAPGLPVLLISQREDAHEEIAGLLAQMRAVIAKRKAEREQAQGAAAGDAAAGDEPKVEPPHVARAYRIAVVEGVPTIKADALTALVKQQLKNQASYVAVLENVLVVRTHSDGHRRLAEELQSKELLEAEPPPDPFGGGFGGPGGFGPPSGRGMSGGIF